MGMITKTNDKKISDDVLEYFNLNNDLKDLLDIKEKNPKIKKKKDKQSSKKLI